MKLYGEFWDTAEVAEHLGISEQSVPMWLKRNGLQRALLMDAQLVREAKAKARGQGYRSDLAAVSKKRKPEEPVVIEQDTQAAKRLKEEALWKASRSTRM